MSSSPQDACLEPVIPLSQLSPEALDWFWPGRLAFGKPSLIDGDPDVGKSLVALDLCARLTTGRPMPDGSRGPGPGNVLLLQAEDGTSDTVIPRLQALGADLGRVFVCDVTSAGHRLLLLPRDLDRLEGAVRQADARLVLFDPVVAFLDRTINMCLDPSVRRAIDPLAELAVRRRFVPLMVRHLNKTGRPRALYRGSGSIGLAAACRSVWLIGQDPYDATRRVLAQTKNNLGPLQPSLAYSLEAVPGQFPTVYWHGVSPWVADQLLAAASASPQRDLACAFLTTFLKDGPRIFPEILAAAKDAGISEPTLRRARKRLQIQSRRVWREKEQLNYWLFEHQQLPADLTNRPIKNAFDRAIAEQKKLFPPRRFDDDEEDDRYADDTD
jgi:hypothetical protein